MRSIALLIISFFLSIGFSESVRAENWKQIYSHRDFSTYVDVSSIEKNGSIYRAWMRIDFIKIENRINKRILLSEIDCSKKQNRTIVIVYYYVDGNNETSQTRYPEWKYIVPGTVGSGEAREICSL